MNAAVKSAAADPLESLLLELKANKVAARPVAAPGLTPALCFEVNPGDWGQLAEAAAGLGFRWVAGWALDEGAETGIQSSVNLTALACFEKQGRYLVFRAPLGAGQTGLPSQTPWFPGADRPERHTQDAFGLSFKGHPDQRRWLRHQAWEPKQFPLRKTFPVAGHPSELSPPDNRYAFQSAQGAGVYEIPVGPIHAGIIEPGHFRFLAVGEQVLNLEQRLGYVHKGIEKIAEGRDPESLARLAGRVSGDTTVGHAFAACLAMERAAGIDVPERGLILRGILAERERVANHLGDLGALCNDVAFAFGNYQYTRLKELWLRNNRAWFGHRFLMDRIVPGGVACDLDSKAALDMAEECNRLRAELQSLRPLLDDNASLQDRFQAAGVLPERTARALGCLGYVARASGVDYDLRRDAPYAPYDRIKPVAVCHRPGDVRARFDVRYDEVYAALDMIRQWLECLREGPVRTEWQAPEAGAEGLGLVEGWRGEILCYLRFGEKGRIARYYPRDPSVFNWSALERLIHGNIVPDFPLCNKSVNGSYSGHDL
jgi:Ni,Fe-hydrogenase III large subunit